MSKSENLACHSKLKKIVSRLISNVTVFSVLLRLCLRSESSVNGDISSCFCSLMLYIHAPVRPSYVHIRMCITLQDPGT